MAVTAGLGSEPLVSIGLPVYNGANFLEAALTSIVSQTYRNIEIVIGDNASTDDTGAICRHHAARDSRILYHRHPANLGASANFDYVFFNSTGPLFKPAAHDDLLAPTFVERCVEAYATRPNLVMVYTRTLHIDADGTEQGPLDDHVDRMGSGSPAMRFGRITCPTHWATPVFGIFRRDAVRSSTILGRYVGSDRTLLAELALAGPWHRVDEFLFLRRDHAHNSTKEFPREHERLAWFDPNPGEGLTFPNWRRLAELIKVIRRSGHGPVVSVLAYGQLVRWAVTPWYRPRFLKLAQDLGMALGGRIRARSHT